VKLPHFSYEGDFENGKYTDVLGNSHLGKSSRQLPMKKKIPLVRGKMKMGIKRDRALLTPPKKNPKSLFKGRH